MARRCWLLKTEPGCFSIQDLAASPGQTTCWSGVRNFQARNFMRDDMALGDRVLFYHSNAEPAAIVGTAVVVREGYPDHTAWDAKDEDHFDSKASPENPIWQMVDIRLESIFDEPLALPALRGVPGLKQMELLRKGSRLSVQPVTLAEFDVVLRLAAQAKKPATAKPAAKASTFKKAATKANAAPAGALKKRIAKSAAAPRSAGKPHTAKKSRRPATAK
jgi:predicted RNA-binding protein with PUA-like domain